MHYIFKVEICKRLVFLLRVPMMGKFMIHQYANKEGHWHSSWNKQTVPWWPWYMPVWLDLLTMAFTKGALSNHEQEDTDDD